MRSKTTFYPVSASLNEKEGQGSAMSEDSLLERVTAGRLRFATTEEFLQRFGLASLQELTATPPLRSSFRRRTAYLKPTIRAVIAKEIQLSKMPSCLWKIENTALFEC
jgi:hypothetical protein